MGTTTHLKKLLFILNILLLLLIPFVIYTEISQNNTLETFASQNFPFIILCLFIIIDNLADFVKYLEKRKSKQSK